jgi:hypothetical protein
MALDGRFRLKLARTAPLLPCGLVTLPQMTLKWFGFFSFLPAMAVLLLVSKEENGSVYFSKLKVYFHDSVSSYFLAR